MINLYIGNHGKKDGIKDYIDILSQIFESRGIDVKVSEELCDSGVNMVIDEFSNTIKNSEIRTLKKSSDSVRFVYVLTEFIEKKFMVRSFNHFGSIIDSSFIAFINIYLRKRRKNFKKARFQDYLAFFLLSPFLPLYGIKFLVTNFINFFKNYRSQGRKNIFKINPQTHHLIYMHMRYLGFEEMIGYADAVILSHGSIEKGYDGFRRELGEGCNSGGVLYPELPHDTLTDFFMHHGQKKKLFIEMTGSITSYRYKFISKINTDILLAGVNNLLGHTKNFPFKKILRIKQINRGAFSLHPPQSVRWPYSSPTRIYRSLCVDKSIPILTKNFNQHPIEDVCIVYKGEETILTMYGIYKNNLALTELMEPRLAKYMKLAKEGNNIVCAEILEIVKNSGNAK